MLSRSALLLLLSFCSLWSLAPGQHVQWTWMQGSKYIPCTPIYHAAQGVADAENSPGAQVQSYAPTWIDKSGRLWLLSSNKNLTCLWRFDPATGLWTWTKGQNPSWGTQGVAAPENTPFLRDNAVTWVDAKGIFWLFGGQSYDLGGWLNDLWSFDPATGNWTWVKGSQKANRTGTYGTQGTPATGNTPGSREGAIGWNTPNGRLWLYGGTGYNESTLGYGTLSDLWSFDPATSQWTWVKGSQNTYDVIGAYGTQGIPSADTTPGARQYSAAWADSRGRLWLFGGLCWRRYFDGKLWDTLNDLWRFDPNTNQWTWMKGSNNTLNYNSASAGPQGAEDPRYTPAGLRGQSAWTDSAGNFWLFGGVSPIGNNYRYSNALWRFNPTTGNWAWFKGSLKDNQPAIYGTRGAAAVANTPGSRGCALAWSGPNGKLWLMGGIYYIDTQHDGPELYNDLWRYDVGTNQWTWVWGDTAYYQPPVMGTQGTPGAANQPGARAQAAAAIAPDGKLWLFGGTGFDGGAWLKYQGYHDDLWRFDSQTAQWTWMKGSRTASAKAVYGTQGTAAPANTPGGRRYASVWSDTSGKLWTFGGESFHNDNGTSMSFRNDLWKFDPATRNWSWIKGSQELNQAGVYGPLGQEADANNPGARMQCASWTDGQGQFWLFGGFSKKTGDTKDQYYNDLWRFNPVTGKWAVIRGNGIANDAGNYGTLGQANGTNTPGARAGAMTWVDASGALWLFGGYGYATVAEFSAPSGYLNDLWRFDPATQQWTWISGACTVNGGGIYGSLGVASATNTPGARQDAATWVDPAGRFWMLGGNSNNYYGNRVTNDLWCFDPKTKLWTWFGGNPTTTYPGYGVKGIYGTLGWGAFDNAPGSRTGAMAWTGKDGRMWLLGGEGYDCQGYSGILGDLWRFKLTTGVGGGAWSRYE